MGLKDRIGVDLGRRARIEDGIEAAIRHGIRYLDVKIDTAPNAIETLTPERIAGIRSACGANGIHLGVHTMSAVNMAEVAPHVRDGVERYLIGHMDTCKLLGGEWIVVHAGFHFTSDYAMRRDAGLERLKRIADHGERIGVTVLLENMNKEPADAEVKYLGFSLEECRWYFDRLQSPSLRWAFTCNHAHLVPEGIDGFLDALDIGRCDEVRIADCRGTVEEHLKPGEGTIDFAAMFRRLDAMGYQGHFMNAFGTLDDMVEGREYLAREGMSAGLA